MLEKTVEAAFMRGVKVHRAWAPKVERLGKGWPDRVVLWQGRIAFVELKRPDGSVSRRQRYIRDRLRKLGFEWWCLYTQEAVAEWIDEWFDENV